MTLFIQMLMFAQNVVVTGIQSYPHLIYYVFVNVYDILKAISQTYTSDCKEADPSQSSQNVIFLLKNVTRK